jgi:hypothetical protein
VQVTPTVDTDYVLTASNAYGSTSSHVSLAVFQPPNSWFAPLPYYGDSNLGTVDFLDLFAANAPWATAASHIQVFKIWTSELDHFSDSVLSNMFAELKRRRIALAIEWGPLEPNGCGSGEGFDGAPALHYAQQIRDHGGTLQYVAFDEPFEFGSLASPVDACHWNADQVAQDAMRHLATIRSVFPDVIVGDIEVVPALGLAADWLERYEAWVDAWQRLAGTPFAFFHFDVDWDSDWKSAVAALSRALKLRHIPVGQIYIGSGSAASDAEWVASTEQRWAEYETHGSPMPGQVIFQSWVPYPKHVLPETDPTTFTGLIDRYYRTRTALAASLGTGSMHGKLTLRDAGNPVANAPVTVTAVPLLGTGQPSSYAVTGTIPAGTNYVTFAVRAGTECSWSLPAAFSVTNFTLDAGAAGRISADFTNQFLDWGYAGAPSVIQVSNGTLQVVANPGEYLNLNHAPIPFSAVAAPYTFSVTATIPLNSFGNACLAAIFQDATPTEFTRVVIPLRPKAISVGGVQTAADGGFAINLGSLPPVNLQLWADYAGSDTLWPAAAGNAVGNAPPLSVTTMSLPSGRVGTNYMQSLVATGGLTPYLWVGVGAPPGLTLHQDGMLSGTPTAAGTYTLTVSVIDDSAPTQIFDVSLPIVIH